MKATKSYPTVHSIVENGDKMIQTNLISDKSVSANVTLHCNQLYQN